VGAARGGAVVVRGAVRGAVLRASAGYAVGAAAGDVLLGGGVVAAVAGGRVRGAAVGTTIARRHGRGRMMAPVAGWGMGATVAGEALARHRGEGPVGRGLRRVRAPRALGGRVRDLRTAAARGAGAGVERGSPDLGPSGMTTGGADALAGGADALAGGAGMHPDVRAGRGHAEGRDGLPARRGMGPRR
jgi:hypothetical protein